MLAAHRDNFTIIKTDIGWSEGDDDDHSGELVKLFQPYCKRNMEARRVNRMVSNGESDGYWNQTECPMNFMRSLLSTKFKIHEAFFNRKGDCCFCVRCHEKRGDKDVYKRGKPSKTYCVPVGWCRFGIQGNDGMMAANNVFESWHVAYHGTRFGNLSRILEGGGRLLIPGELKMGGKKVKIPKEHIRKSFYRQNRYTKKEELFNPNQIFTSPSIRYAGCGVYASSYVIQHENYPDKSIRFQFAFSVRQRPGSYLTGQETVGATAHGIKVDPHFSNDELECYTQEGVSVVLTGLLVKVEFELESEI